MTEERMQALELKIAFLERANQDLSDVVYDQQREIATLRAQIVALAEQFDVYRAERRPLIEERPPHY